MNKEFIAAYKHTINELDIEYIKYIYDFILGVDKITTHTITTEETINILKSIIYTDKQDIIVDFLICLDINFFNFNNVIGTDFDFSKNINFVIDNDLFTPEFKKLLNVNKLSRVQMLIVMLKLNMRSVKKITNKIEY